jgi:hypothetical protein
VSFTGGGFTLSAPNGSLATGAAVSLSTATSAPGFPSALAVGAPAPVDISTQTEPTSAVTLSTAYSPEVAPTGTRPLLASYSEPMGIWVPVDTTADPTTKQLVAQVPHLSTWTGIASGVGSFLGGVATTITTSAVQGAVAIDNGLAAGINTVTTDAGNGLGWLSYQINKWAFSARTDPPDCGALPSWVQDPIQTTDSAGGDPNAFLYACGQTGTADALQLVVVNNRPYAVELELPEQPSAVTVTPDSGEPFSGSVDLLLADAWRTMSGGRRLYLPPLSSTAIDLPQPQENVGVDTWHLSGEYNPALVLGSMLLNQALGKLIDAGLSGLPGADTVLGQITSCVAQSIGQPGAEDILTASPGPTLTDAAGAVRDCLQTGASAAVDTITKAAAEQLQKNGTLSQTEAQIALRAHDMQGKLGELAAAQQAYELGGFTIEAALAKAGQLAPIGITYTPKPPVAEVDDSSLLSAPVPALRGNPAGNLVDGVLPDTGNGTVNLVQSGGGAPAHGDLTGDGVKDAAAVIGATSGSGGEDEYVELYTNGNQRFAEWDPAAATNAQHAFVSAMVIQNGDLLIDGSSQVAIDQPLVYWSARLHWDGQKLNADVQLGNTGIADAGLWSDSQLTITPNSLGAVKIGMSLADVKEAAGVYVGVSGDGFYDSTQLPPGSLALFEQGSTVTCVGASLIHGATPTQRVVTPDGVAVGDPVTKLLGTYGAKATFVPAPTDGRTMNAGYVVSSSDGDLAFILDSTQQTINGISGGPTLTPNSCAG